MQRKTSITECEISQRCNSNKQLHSIVVQDVQEMYNTIKCPSRLEK